MDPSLQSTVSLRPNIPSGMCLAILEELNKLSPSPLPGLRIVSK